VNIVSGKSSDDSEHCTQRQRTNDQTEQTWDWEFGCWLSGSLERAERDALVTLGSGTKPRARKMAVSNERSNALFI
jgi:hypothetical protein